MDNSTTESTKLECRKSCKSEKVRESIPGSQLLSDVQTFFWFQSPPPAIHSHTQLVKDVTVVVAMVANIDKQLDIVNKPTSQLESLYNFHSVG